MQIGYLSGLPFIFSTLVLFFGGKVVDLISSQKWATVAKTRKAATAFGTSDLGIPRASNYYSFFPI